MADKFQTPGSPGQSALLTAADAFVLELGKAGVPAKFIAYELPADFVQDLKDDIAAIATALGAESAVTSPTFTLLHEYPGGRLPIYHFDFYRIESADAALQIGLDEYLDEYLDGDGVCLIEWADKFPALLPPHTRWLRFTHRADGAGRSWKAKAPPFLG